MNYIVVTGYWNGAFSCLDWFYPIWWRNVQNLTPKPQKVFVVAQGGHRIEGAPGDWIHLQGNAQCIPGQDYPANQVVVCLGALLAWLNHTDLLYFEQDLLAFGPWMERLYREIGDKGMIMGYDKTCPEWGQNSLVLFKRHFLLDFVRWFLGTEPMTQERLHETQAEIKFTRFVRENPDKACFYDYGYDRERPFNIQDEVWNAQKFNDRDLIRLREAGLIAFEGEPPKRGAFTNTQHPKFE